jgi:hypothetical protein
MVDAAHEITCWNVAFAARPRPFYWFQRPLAVGYRHIYLFAPVPGGFLLLDPYAAHVDVTLVDERRMADRLVADAALVLIVPVRKGYRASTVRFRWLPTCVSFAKHFLGFEGHAWTPRQLYRALARRADVRRIL